MSWKRSSSALTNLREWHLRSLASWSVKKKKNGNNLIRAYLKTTTTPCGQWFFTTTKNGRLSRPLNSNNNRLIFKNYETAICTGIQKIPCFLETMLNNARNPMFWRKIGGDRALKQLTKSFQ